MLPELGIVFEGSTLKRNMVAATPKIVVVVTIYKFQNGLLCLSCKI